MDTNAKEVLNEYGYETWTAEEIDKDYKVSKEKVNSSHKALLKKREDNLVRDVAAYESMRARLPPGPPGQVRGCS